MEVSDFGKAMGALNKACGWDYIYRQVAEECAELNKACLKLVRAINNETPMPVEAAAAKYIEEIADVWLMIAIARTDMTPEEKDIFDKTVEYKYNRLMQRMEAKKTTHPQPAAAHPPTMVGTICSCCDLVKRMEDDLK